MDSIQEFNVFQFYESAQNNVTRDNFKWKLLKNQQNLSNN